MVHVEPGIDENMIRPPFSTTATDLIETRSHHQLLHLDLYDNAIEASPVSSHQPQERYKTVHVATNGGQIQTCTPSNTKTIRPDLGRIQREGSRQGGWAFKHAPWCIPSVGGATPESSSGGDATTHPRPSWSL